MMTIKPFKLERYYTRYEHTAAYSLCNSDCESMTAKELLSLENGAVDRFHNVWLGYTETKGDIALRQDISSMYTQIAAEDLLVCSGAQEPIFLFAQAMLKAGDEVIVQTPCYQSLQSVPESMNCKVLPWQVRYENNKPIFDLDELKRMITNKTKVIYLNTPHNPTGFHFSKTEQLEIIALARAYGILVFCDEVYRELEYQADYQLPSISDVYENGVAVGVMSKAYGLPGLRIGWLSTRNKEVLEKVAILKEYTTICNAAPAEFLAGIALRNRATILTRNLTIIKNNLSLYEAFFAKYSDLFSWYRPNAGPITLVKIKFDMDDLLLAEAVLKDKGVLLLPGEVYDYKGFFRIGLGRKTIPKALEKFEEYIIDKRESTSVPNPFMMQ